MKRTFLAFATAILCFFSADAARSVNVIPCPSSVQMLNGSYSPKDGKLNVKKEKDEKLGAEAYVLDITPKGVFMRASSDAGFRFATKTLEQLVAQFGQTLPACHIDDAPRFAYRGLHLDCARHFFSVDFVKKYLDVMATYKLNRFHWHLTEDQGWRIEIKKYPKLTQIGAWREGTQVGYQRGISDGVRYGGFYTQEEIRDVVKYASERGITVIPEIDLPGHMVAALASYPELGCTGGPYKVWEHWGVDERVMCPGKEDMFVFLEDIFTEICELFPSEYIHIGGDECPKTEWAKCPACQKRIAELGLASDEKGTKEQKLQNYVTARIQDMLAKKGRKVIGWDEVLEGDLKPGATIMSWRGVKGGIAAAERGFDVIMTPNTYCYFDYGYTGRNAFMPKCMPYHDLDISKVYYYEPYGKLTAAAQKHILGVQANLWTEYLAAEDEVEFHLLPRLLALSEVQWCSPGNKNYKDFLAALNGTQYGLLEDMDLDFARVPESKVKLISWDLSEGMWADNNMIFTQFHRWVGSRKPDICVWRTSDNAGPCADFGKIAKKLGHEYVQKISGTNGTSLVVCAKYPISTPVEGLKEVLELKVGGRSLKLICVNLKGAAEPLAELKRILDGSIGADKHAGTHNWMLVGDINSLSSGDNWIYRLPASDGIFKAYDYITAETPLVDVVPPMNPGSFNFTEPERRRSDFVFSTLNIARYVQSAGPVWETFTTPTQDPSGKSALFAPAKHLPLEIRFRM